MLVEDEPHGGEHAHDRFGGVLVEIAQHEASPRRDDHWFVDGREKLGRTGIENAECERGPQGHPSVTLR